MPWARFIMLCALTQYPALCGKSNLPFSFFKALEGEKQFAGSSLPFFVDVENILFISRDVHLTYMSFSFSC